MKLDVISLRLFSWGGEQAETATVLASEQSDGSLFVDNLSFIFVGDL